VNVYFREANETLPAELLNRGIASLRVSDLYTIGGLLYVTPNEFEAGREKGF
jgi:hypothetical protein